MRTTIRSVLVGAAILITGAAGSARGGAFDAGGFKAGSSTESYLKNAAALYEDAILVPAPDLKDTTALRLRFDNEMYAEFLPVPVDQATAYAVSFQGKWTNPDTIENNAMYGPALRDTWESALEAVPVTLIEFADASGKKLDARILSVMPYGTWQRYRYTFYPPPGAATMVLKIKSGRNDGEFFVANPALEPQKAEADKIVMTFRQPDDAVHGRAFGILVDGAIRKGPGGAALVASGNERTTVFPISKPGTYRMSLKGAPQREKSRNVVLTFLGGDNKSTGNVSSQDLATKPLEFKLPDGTVGGHLTIPNYWLDEVRIERVR